MAKVDSMLVRADAVFGRWLNAMVNVENAAGAVCGPR